MAKKKFNCYSFFEFYMIESIKFNLSQVDEAVTFLPSYQYLEDKVEEYQNKFVPAFAQVIRDYLWFASLGEARHGGSASDGALFQLRDSNPEYSYGRTFVYTEMAEQFPPTEHNIRVLKSMFYDYYWRGSYGGSSWGNIVRAVEHYEEWDNVTFIDHAADLQHNGGIAFNKSGIDFWDIEGYSQLMNFLSFKFNADNLIADLDDLNADITYWSSILSKDILFLINKTLNMTDNFPLRWEMHGYEHIPMNWKSFDYDLKWRYTDDVVLDDVVSMPECRNCGTTIWDGDSDYCKDCIYTCDHCGTETPRVTTTADLDNLCTTCYEDYYAKCNNCNEVYHTDELDDRGECEKCVSKRCKVCGGYSSVDGTETYFVDDYNFNTMDDLEPIKSKTCTSCLAKLIKAGYTVHKDLDNNFIVSIDESVWENPFAALYHKSLELVSEVSLYDINSNVKEQEEILLSMKESRAWVQ